MQKHLFTDQKVQQAQLVLKVQSLQAALLLLNFHLDQPDQQALVVQLIQQLLVNLGRQWLLAVLDFHFDLKNQNRQSLSNLKFKSINVSEIASSTVCSTQTHNNNASKIKCVSSIIEWSK